MSQYATIRDYVIKKYGLPSDIKRGTPIVAWGTNAGHITGFSGASIIVRVDGYPHSQIVHPLDLTYNGEPQSAKQERIDAINAKIKWFNRQLGSPINERNNANRGHK